MSIPYPHLTDTQRVMLTSLLDNLLKGSNSDTVIAEWQAFIQLDTPQQITRSFLFELEEVWKEHYPNTSFPLTHVSHSNTQSEEVQSDASETINAEAPAESTNAQKHSPALSVPALPHSPRFQLPNAKAGVAYSAQITALDHHEVPIVKIGFPAELGLSFDEKTQTISGQPVLAGDHRIIVYWEDANHAVRQDEVMLTVIADPKTLWKNLPSPSDAPYQKPDTVTQMINAGSYQLIAASKRGRSHAHIGAFRDDDFFIHASPDSGWMVMVASDGAGSATYSREGSRLICEIAGRYLAKDVETITDADDSPLTQWLDSPELTQRELHERLYAAFGNAAREAVTAIMKEADKQNVSPRQFASTMLATIAKPINGSANNLFVASFWVGDGAIGVYGVYDDTQILKLMGTPDSGEFAGQTQFLDSSLFSHSEQIWNRIKFDTCVSPTAVMLMTDGVSDPYFETPNALSDPLAWQVFWQAIAPSLSHSAPDKHLAEWLDFFRAGYHDDRTLVVLKRKDNVE